MAGGFYIWIMAAFFIGCVGVLGLLTGLFLIGHWLEKRKGATHGFLELPTELRTRPDASDSVSPAGKKDQDAPAP